MGVDVFEAQGTSDQTLGATWSSLVPDDQIRPLPWLKGCDLVRVPAEMYVDPTLPWLHRVELIGHVCRRHPIKFDSIILELHFGALGLPDQA